MQFYPNGIYIQDLSLEQTPYICKNYPYRGIAAHYAFPLSRQRGKQWNLNAYLLSKHIQESEHGFFLIPSLSAAREYITHCKKLQCQILCLFVESSRPNPLWKDDIPQKTVLGYECANINFDPEFCWYLDNETVFFKERCHLNANGLFDTWEEADAFREKVYTLYPNEEEEFPYADTYVIRVSEVTCF